MFKKLFISIGLLTSLLFSSAIAQDSTYARKISCGVTGEKIRAFSLDSLPHTSLSTALVLPSAFPSMAIDTCGKFRIFYADRAIYAATGIGAGFAESGVGIIRRNTMCSVLQYIQSKIDFSKIPDTEYVRIYIDTSCSGIYPASHFLGHGYLGFSSPYFNTYTIGDTVNGCVYDYITKGVDPNIGKYHGYMQINFDSAYFTGSGYADPIKYNNGLSNVSCDEIDLYTVLIHYMHHTMGWFSWTDSIHTGFSSPSNYSNLDLSIHKTPWLKIATNPFASLINVFPISTSTAATYWINGNLPPENYPVEQSNWGHLSIGYYENRVSPGESYNYLMRYAFNYGDMHRIYQKGELDILRNSIGYSWNKKFEIDSVVTLSNHLPFSAKMGSDTLNRLFYMLSRPEKS